MRISHLLATAGFVLDCIHEATCTELTTRTFTGVAIGKAIEIRWKDASGLTQIQLRRVDSEFASQSSYWSSIAVNQSFPDGSFTWIPEMPLPASNYSIVIASEPHFGYDDESDGMFLIAGANAPLSVFTGESIDGLTTGDSFDPNWTTALSASQSSTGAATSSETTGPESEIATQPASSNSITSSLPVLSTTSSSSTVFSSSTVSSASTLSTSTTLSAESGLSTLPPKTSGGDEQSSLETGETSQKDAVAGDPGGMSTGAKIGVGITIGVIATLGFAIGAWFFRRHFSFSISKRESASKKETMGKIEETPPFSSSSSTSSPASTSTYWNSDDLQSVVPYEIDGRQFRHELSSKEMPHELPGR